MHQRAHIKKTWWMHVLILEFVLYFILHKQCLCIEFKRQNPEYEKKSLHACLQMKTELWFHKETT